MNEKQLDFFLGALSPTGFGGYYSQLVRDTSSHVVLLKAGPGCGKSTLLRRIAQHLIGQGETVETVHCSADPNSLDAVVCNARRFAVVDATAPHALEPAYPVAFEQVMPLYYCLDASCLRANRAEVITLFDRNAALAERATRYLAAAGSLLQDTARTAQCFTDLAKARELARALARRYFPAPGAGAHEDVRLLSAVTWQGVVVYKDTISKLADTVVRFDDPFGCSAKVMLRVLRDEALARGHRIVTCYCPMSPFDKIEHVFLPELRLAFITQNDLHPLEPEAASLRTIHCQRFCSKEGLSLRRKRLQFNKKAAAELLSQAVALLRETKECHDALEQYYMNAADFTQLDRAFEKIVAQLG